MWPKEQLGLNIWTLLKYFSFLKKVLRGKPNIGTALALRHILELPDIPWPVVTHTLPIWMNAILSCARVAIIPPGEYHRIY